MYKKVWFLDLFVGKFVILHQSSLKTYLSSGLFSDPSGSHFEILKSNFEEFDLSQFGDLLTLLALNRSVDTTLSLSSRTAEWFRHGFVWFCPFILGLLGLYFEPHSHRSLHYAFPNMTACLLAWRSGLSVQTRVGSFNWIKPDKTRFDLMNTKCESWGEFYSEFVLRFWKVLILRFGLQPRSNTPP